MSSYLVDRGRAIFWRRRIPLQFAAAFGRSHLVIGLGIGDPKLARRLSRRLNVRFDDAFESLKMESRIPTPEEQRQIIESLRQLVRDRCETTQLFSVRSTPEQWQEYLAKAPAFKLSICYSF